MIIIKGFTKWAKVVTPDTKFNADGEYSIQVIMPEADAQEIVESLEEIRDDFYKKTLEEKPKLKNSITLRGVYEEETDENGDNTGNVIFKAKLKAVITSQKTGKTYKQFVTIVDAKKKPLQDANIGNGSIVKIAVEPSPYFIPSTKEVGVSLRLKAVQVIDLKEFGNAASIFDEEDGYEAKAENDKAPFIDEAEDF